MLKPKNLKLFQKFFLLSSVVRREKPSTYSKLDPQSRYCLRFQSTVTGNRKSEWSFVWI